MLVRHVFRAGVLLALVTKTMEFQNIEIFRVWLSPVCRENRGSNRHVPYILVLNKFDSLNAFKWSSLFSTIFVVSHFTSWPILRISGVSNGGPFFGDLRKILAAADCAGRSSEAIYSESCRYDYGSWLIRGFQLIGFGEAQSQMLGWTLLFATGLFLGFLVASLAITSIRVLLLAFFVFTSPPILMLVERSNVDILIIVLLAFCALCVSRGWMVCAIGLTVAASVFKFYPAPLLLWLFLSSSRWLHKLIAALSFLLVCFQITHDLSQMSVDIPEPTFVAFGNLVFGLYLEHFGYATHRILQNGLGLLLVLLCVLAIYVLEKYSDLNLPKTQNIFVCDGYVDAVFTIFSLVFFACFFGGMNYDYRLILLLVPALILTSRTKENSFTNTALATTLFAASWGSWYSIFQPIGDVAIALWCAVLLRCLFVETILKLVKAPHHWAIKRMEAFTHITQPW